MLATARYLIASKGEQGSSKEMPLLSKIPLETSDHGKPMISDSMQSALFTQLNDEFSSAYLYLAMSAYCANIDFSGAATWLKYQYEEEQMHATKIYNYLIDQGARVELQPIPQPAGEYDNILHVFTASLEHEQSMTRKLNELSDLALKDKDHATYNLLQWYVNEQVEEEATVSEIISKLKLVKEDGYGLLMIDNELGARAQPRQV
jgi:ferritin